MLAKLSQGEAVIYTTHGHDPQRTTILPVRPDDRQPKRSWPALGTACELLVHPEHSLRLTVAEAREGALGLAKIEPGSADL